jgi:hypothetical protein
MKYATKTKDPLVLELLAAVEADPRTERDICADAGHGTGSISKLRLAQHGVTAQKLADLGKTVGLTLGWLRPIPVSASLAPEILRQLKALGLGRFIVIHPDILAAHAEFGGDLVDMQRRYDAYDKEAK